MRSNHEQQDPIEPAGYRDLQLLSEVEDTPAVSQRELSQRVGIALGLTNIMLRNLAQKGYVRLTKAGWKRWLYTLTPDGFSYKIRLTMAYVHRVLDHYQKVRQTLRGQLEPLGLNKESRLAICGTGEFAEIVYLGLREIGIEEIDFFAPANPDGGKFLGMPVHDVTSLSSENYDLVVIASLVPTREVFAELQSRGVAPDKMVTFFMDGGVRGGK